MESSTTKFVTAPSRAHSTSSSRLRFVIGAIVVIAAIVGSIVVLLPKLSPRDNNTTVYDRMRVSANGVVVKVANDSYVELAVASLSTFRVSVSYFAPPSKLDNPMLAPQSALAPFSVSISGNAVILTTPFGSVSIDSVSGAFLLADENNKTLTSTPKLSHYVTSLHRAKLEKNDTCANPHENFDVNGGSRTPKYPDGLQNTTQASCCQACNDDPDCTVWVWAWPGHEFQGYNCFPLSGDSISIVPVNFRTTGGAIVTPPPQTVVDLGKTADTKFYGAGCGSENANTLSKTSAYPMVTNTEMYVPYYYSSDGYSALTVSSYQYRTSLMYAYPAQWDLTADTTVTWKVDGAQADLYLTPASSHALALSRYWDLTGRPVIPPRYIFGFLACRWGWQSYDYVVDMMTNFRNGSYPIDGWISDFEWYTNTPDYSLPEQGLPDFYDFTYNPTLFPDPVNNIKMYHEQFHLRFGGIRKPRLGNSDLLTMVRAKNWNVGSSNSGGAAGGSRNLNYSIPELREWYTNQTQHFLEDGVDFYWDDEGETFYFAFHWWNTAQLDGLAKYDPKRRFFTINRSYTPGLQRLGAAQWTGDVDASWNSLAEQPGYVLNWGMAGSNYIACDIGGFNGPDDTPLLLTRWYQVGVFMPMMRVHSSLGNLPHFPFLYGQEAGDAMRKAMNLRYQLVPYHYSLAHAAYQPNGLPINRALLMHYPDDPNVQELTVPWLDGPSLLVCAVVKEDNTSSCYQPSGRWYEFNTSTSSVGPAHINLSNVPLDVVPVYVRAGAIVPMAPVLQYTDLLPGGPLNLQVYGGDDGQFTMIEDDGETTGYMQGDFRAINFSWNDTAGRLTWSVDGTFRDSHSFRELIATVFSPDGSIFVSEVLPITNSHTLSVK